MILISLVLGIASVQAIPTAQVTESTVPIIDAQASPQELIDLARANLKANQWQAAAIGLQAARNRMEHPPAVLAYDEGVAWARSGDLHQAHAAFESAMHDATSPQLAADAAYNLGNVANQLAQPESGDADQQAAIDALTAALNHYRQAILKNPRDVDARANAQLTWQQLEMLKQQQEEQEQDQKQEQDQNQQDDNQDQQEPSQEQQQDEQEQDEQEQNQQQDQQQEQQDQQQDQQQQQQQEQQDQQQEQQDQQQEQQDQQQDQPKEQQESSATPAESKPMTREEAQRLLQRVRDRERERTKKEADHAPGRPTTGKDW
jgi:hypothetical protein